MRRFVVAVALVWGCSEVPTGPAPDPTMLRADLAAVRSVFDAPVVRSAGFFFNVSALSAPRAGQPLVPDSLLGRTFAWSCAAQAYALSAETGAPVNGVRLRLYQLAASGAIQCPITPIGQLDLFDVSIAATRAVRVTATGTSGDSLVDYTLTRGLTDSVSTASGFVSDGHERLVFQWTEAFGVTHSSAVTTAVDDSARDFHATLQESAQMGVDTYADDVDLTLRKTDLTLELKGSSAWSNTYGSWHEVVTVDSVLFARVEGDMTQGGPTVMPPRLTNEQRQLVLDVVNTPGVLRSALGRVFDIARRLVGAP